MKGPNEGAAPPDETTSTLADGTEPAVPPRPPGGKALLRLVSELQRLGLDTEAGTVVTAALAPEQETVTRARLAELVGLDLPEPGAGTTPTDSALASSGEEPAALYATAAAQLSLGPPTPSGPQWRSLGPWTVPNGQTYSSTRINVSGRVSSIAVDPSNPAHVLCGAAHGGVWESFDRGGSWAPRTDYATTLTVGALAFTPSNPSVVLAGLGEGNWWAFLGNGVLRSTDGGTTWAPLCTAPFVGQGFFDLRIDPADARHVLGATTNGVFQSVDGGVNWRQTLFARTWALSMTPTGGPTSEILAASSDGVHRSTDGGVNWTAVALPGAPGQFQRLAVAIAPSNPSVAYAWGSSNGQALLYRRAGGTWTSVATPPGVATGQAWYDWFLAVSPDRDSQIYCGAIQVHRGDLSGGSWTWSDISVASIHPDQHAIAFEPGNSNQIYVGNDGGLFRSPDRGGTWQHCNNGLEISEFEYLGQDWGSSHWLIGGTQDNGTERWTGSPSWTHVQDGDGGDCAVNRTDPATVFHTFFGMSLERSTSRGDWGSWTGLTLPIGPNENSLFYPPLETSATGGDTVAIGGGALYISRDNGTSWDRRPFPTAAVASALYIPTPDLVYVGTTDGRLFRTSFNAGTWGSLSAVNVPWSSSITDIHANGNRLWVTLQSFGGPKVYRSDDAGANWINCTTGTLPALPLNAVEVDPANANRVWVAADLGVYQSLDAGATWSTFSASLPNAFVGDLVFQPHARVLRAALRNRGVWEIPVDGWMTQPICGVQWNGTIGANQTARWFTFNWPATWHVIWTIMPTTASPGGPSLTWKVTPQRANAEYVTYWITVTNQKASPVSFEGRYCILSRY